jgi:excisionase family DNA binding protein
MAEAARLAGLHRNTIYLWVKEGRLEAVRSGRERLVNKADLLALVEAER